MSVESLQQERARTEQRIEALSRELTGIVDAADLVATDDEHDPEGATIAFERQQVAALLAQARTRLVELDAALERMASGSYGRCESCGAEIPAGRLVARPSATRCVACAS